MHYLDIEDEHGNLADAIPLCTDSCHRDYATRLGVTYEGWNGCHETELTTFCANCGVALAGFDNDCADIDENVIVNRFRSETGERCKRHNGAHWVQLPSIMLAGV